jgi:hypothetical protein
MNSLCYCFSFTCVLLSFMVNFHQSFKLQYNGVIHCYTSASRYTDNTDNLFLLQLPLTRNKNYNRVNVHPKKISKHRKFFVLQNLRERHKNFFSNFMMLQHLIFHFFFSVYLCVFIINRKLRVT